MKLPYIILDVTNPNPVDKWKSQFVANNRKRHEGIWRRTQEPATAKHSGYVSKRDARWKLVHFFDEYDLIDNDGTRALAITKPYLWWNTALPASEMVSYHGKTIRALQQGGWKISKSHDDIITALRGDLTCIIRYLPIQTAEQLSGRKLPSNYTVLECEMFGPEMHLNEEERSRPWGILRGGIRKPLPHGNPRIASDTKTLQKFCPFHLELGCGPSIEAGVPPLSHLHKTYAISNPRTHHFLISKEDDLPERLLSYPEEFYKDASLIYATALKAEPKTKFYQSIKRLHNAGIILDPVFTNNYDGLVSEIGMHEFYMRRFEDSHILPDVKFNPNAKALVVVGSHADRRKLQEKARASHLQVIYVDPEKYWDENSGAYYNYDIESPQDNDLIYHMSADEFATTVLANL